MVAWGQMLVDYSKDKGVMVAVADTFDGAHPCPMCLKIKEGKQQEKSDKGPLPLNKTEKSSLWLTSHEATELPELTWKRDTSIVSFVTLQEKITEWSTLPPTPPPRCGAALNIA